MQDYRTIHDLPDEEEEAGSSCDSRRIDKTRLGPGNWTLGKKAPVVQALTITESDPSCRFGLSKQPTFRDLLSNRETVKDVGKPSPALETLRKQKQPG